MTHDPAIPTPDSPQDGALVLDWRKRNQIMRQLRAAGLPCKMRHFRKLARSMGYTFCSRHPRGPVTFRPNEPVPEAHAEGDSGAR